MLFPVPSPIIVPTSIIIIYTLEFRIQRSEFNLRILYIILHFRDLLYVYWESSNLPEMKSSKKEPVHLHVELNDVLARVGVFGPWQFRIVIMLMVASFIGGKTGLDKPFLIIFNSYPLH